MKTRLFVSRDVINGAEAVLDGDRARYLSRVLRLRVGDAITVFDGTGPEWAATIAAMAKDTVTLDLGERREPRTESPAKIHLAQGISRGERMDYVVQKATELGVVRITPVLTAHGVVRLDERRAARRREHWEGIARSACEQSGRTCPPLVDAPLSLNDWFGGRPAGADLNLILIPGTGAPLAAVPAPRIAACVLIGPEGGFSRTEHENAQLAGFRPVSLGPRILRTETAAAAALAVMQANWGDLRG